MRPAAYLALAAKFAPRSDVRQYRLAALGLRSDGAIVMSRNGPSLDEAAMCHAEARLCRKLDRGATLFVTRILGDGSWALARPCAGCLVRLRGKRVARVFYSIGPGEWGCLEP